MYHDTAPSGASSGSVTLWLQRWRCGDRDVLPLLVAQFYDQLKRRARRCIHGDPSLSATALINEWYLCMMRRPVSPIKNRRHFLAGAALTLRHLAGNFRRDAAPREKLLPLHEAVLLASTGPLATKQHAARQVLALLAEQDPRCAEIFVMRYWLGLSLDELVHATSLSRATVQRELLFARRWVAAQVDARTASS